MAELGSVATQRDHWKLLQVKPFSRRERIKGTPEAKESCQIRDSWQCVDKPCADSKNDRRVGWATESGCPAGCSQNPSSKAAASEQAKRTLLEYVEPLSDVRTPLVDFVNSLLEPEKPVLNNKRAVLH